MIKFYIELFGMKLLCCEDYLEGKFMFVFVGYEDESMGIVIEFIYNWEMLFYDFGNGFGYLVVVVDDVYVVCEKIKV